MGMNEGMECGSRLLERKKQRGESLTDVKGVCIEVQDDARQGGPFAGLSRCHRGCVCSLNHVRINEQRR